MTDNPILTKHAEFVREQTAYDIHVWEEGGRYFVEVGGPVAGPMSHGEVWFLLIGIHLGAYATPTLDTQKRRTEKVRDEAFKAAKARHEERKSDGDAATD